MDSYLLDPGVVVTVDLHAMTVTQAQAQAHLTARINRLPSKIKEVVVIHGYNGGTALQKMVRKDFKHPRVKRKILSLNPGITSLLLG